MALKLEKLYYHASLDSGDSTDSSFESDDGFNLSISIPDPLAGMPDNFFDWPEAKIVAKYWTKDCTEKVKSDLKEKGIESWRNFKIKDVIGVDENKELLEKLKLAKMTFEEKSLWPHGYTTPPAYFAQAIGSIMAAGQEGFTYIDKTDIKDIDTPQKDVPILPSKNVQINTPIPNTDDFSNVKYCVLCHSPNVSFKPMPFLGGLMTRKTFICEACGATLRQSGQSYKLIATRDQVNKVWQKYAKHTLTAREWVTIGNGGLSDQDQKLADIEQLRKDYELWLTKIRSGKIEVKMINAALPVILKVEEKCYCILPNITLKEPRSVRTSSGYYGGPRVRIAKGVSFGLGRFGSSSESHQEIRNIDSGTIVVTNSRFIFAGKMKTISLDIRKILQIDPFTDGIGLHRDGREKTQYFLWANNLASIKFSQEGREQSQPFSGLILQCLIEGAIHSPSK